MFEMSHDLTTSDSLEKKDELEHTEDSPSHSTVPDNQSPENISEVNIPTTPVNLVDDSIGYQLPF